MDPILFAGGDQRTLAALSYMQNQGYSTETYAVTHRFPLQKRIFSALILPFPCLKQGRLNAPMLKAPPTLTELIAETGINPEKIPVIGGPLTENPFSHYTDLSLSEELKLRNAVTTAEGALSLLIQNTDRALFGMPILIVGYGAIGKRLSQLLLSLGAEVTVAARKEKDRVAAALAGCGTQDTATIRLKGFRGLINTVPVPLIDRPLLEQREKDLCILELASPPYGMDPSLAEEMGIHYIPGPALPGKVAPLTAGEDLAKTLILLLSEMKAKGSDTSFGT